MEGVLLYGVLITHHVFVESLLCASGGRAQRPLLPQWLRSGCRWINGLWHRPCWDISSPPPLVYEYIPVLTFTILLGCCCFIKCFKYLVTLSPLHF